MRQFCTEFFNAKRPMGFLTGKKLLITGVLSNRSIAYGIAKACHAARGGTGLQLRGRALQGAHHRVRGRLRLHPDLRLRRRRRRPDRQAVPGPVGALAEVRRLRAQHRLRAARGDRRQFPGRPVARELPHRPRHQRLQLPGHGQGGPALSQRQVVAADADLPGRDARDPQLQHHGPGQGQPGGVGALPGRGGRTPAGRAQHARQRHQRRPDQDAGRQRHQGLRQAAQHRGQRRRRCAAT